MKIEGLRKDLKIKYTKSMHHKKMISVTAADKSIFVMAYISMQPLPIMVIFGILLWLWPWSWGFFFFCQPFSKFEPRISHDTNFYYIIINEIFGFINILTFFISWFLYQFIYVLQYKSKSELFITIRGLDIAIVFSFK